MLLFWKHLEAAWVMIWRKLLSTQDWCVWKPMTSRSRVNARTEGFCSSSLSNMIFYYILIKESHFYMDFSYILIIS